MVNDEFVWEVQDLDNTPERKFLRDVMRIGKFEEIYIDIAEMTFECYQKDPDNFKPENWKLRAGYDDPNTFISGRLIASIV